MNRERNVVQNRKPGERLEDITVHGNCNPVALIKRLTDCYLGGLQPVTKNNELDAIHRKVILQHPVLRNSLFRRLLAGPLSREQYKVFFSEYNNASQRSFYMDVLPTALEAHDHPSWKKYIRHIILEESEPRQHHLMFEEFMNDCGFSREEPAAAADKYARNLLAGYTRDLPFAAGYALGVEVEAGYEIALLWKALEHRFRKELTRTEWFNVHVGGDQEVEHARVSVNLVEDVLASGGSLEAVRAGFVQFCDDVNEFMEHVNRTIDASV